VLLRVDETLPGVRVALADSAAPGTPLTGIRAVDGLTVRARLLSGAGEDVTAAALAGTVTQPIAGGVASFGDLVVRGTAGPGFEVRFEPSWRARCNSRLVDPNCEGVCCAATDPFAVFPYAVKLEPPTLPSAAEGAPLGEVRVQLVDYAGALLSGIGPASQFAVKAYLTRQGEFLHAFLAGAASAPVDGGVAAFTDLAVTGYAGSGLSVRFEEAGTRIAEALVPFKVFPAKLAVDSPPPPHVVAGAALADAAVSLRAAAGGVLASVAAADGYDVAVRAVKWVDGAWAECSGCLAGEAAARVRTPDAGRAAFDGGALRVAARVGRFALRFALARDQLAPVEADSAPFGVAPAALELDASLAEAYFVDEELPECQVALLDADGAPMAGVALADGANVTVAVVWPGRAAPPPAARLRGRAWALADGGYANFANLSVAGAAGVGAQLLFEYVDAVTGARLNASSERFSVAPARLAFPGLPPHATAGVVLPPRAVLAQDEAGAPLALDAAHDALALTAALAAYAPLNESDAPPRGAAPRDLAWDPDASAAECEARAAAAGAAYFALAEPPRAFGCAFGGTRCAAGDAEACAEADADGGFAEDCAAAGRAAAAAAEAGVTLGEEGLAVDAVGAFCAAATGAGEAPCLFPFLHGGVNHSQCITDGNDGVPWCATHRGGPVLGRGNCSCVGGCASSFRYSALELLGAPARLAGANATLNGTAARFSALRIEGVFGSRAARLRFESAVGALPPVAVLSAPLSVDPARLVPTNLLGRRTPASAPLPVSVAFGDGDADLLAPLPRSGAYAVAAALRLGDTDLTQHLVGGAPAAVLGGRAAWNLSFPTAAARGARLHFSTALENGTALRAASRAFFVLPDALAVEYNASVGLAGVAGRDLPAVVVSGRAADGATIPCFGYTFVLALINGSSGEPVPACATGWSHPAGCVSGTFEQPADSGTARFADVRPVNVTGVGFVLRVALRGENVSADSPAFDVFPGDLRIVAGRTDFTGDYLILNRAVERYAVRFLASQGGAPLAQVPRARFNVSVSLVRDPPAGAAGAAPPGDVSHRLAGTRWHLAAWDAAGGAHVAFTDLEVLAAGADLRLKFRLEDELSTMSVATGRFRAVPHALRVAQDCYNGARVNASAPIPQGFPPLECVAPNPDATAALGVFGAPRRADSHSRPLCTPWGHAPRVSPHPTPTTPSTPPYNTLTVPPAGHLAGFYYYANNAYVGPLLRNVRGAAPVPPVTVLLTDLAGETQAHLDARDGAQLAVGVQLFLEGASQPRSAALRGTTQRAAEGGAAHFDDLVVGRVEGCGVSCRLELRFVVFGAVCVDSWCASLRLGVANAPLVPPHRLGSHPAFPGGAAVVGALALALDADALSDNDAAVFRKARPRPHAPAPERPPTRRRAARSRAARARRGWRGLSRGRRGSPRRTSRSRGRRPRPRQAQRSSRCASACAPRPLRRQTPWSPPSPPRSVPRATPRSPGDARPRSSAPRGCPSAPRRPRSRGRSSATCPSRWSTPARAPRRLRPTAPPRPAPRPGRAGAPARCSGAGPSSASTSPSPPGRTPRPTSPPTAARSTRSPAGRAARTVRCRRTRRSRSLAAARRGSSRPRPRARSSPRGARSRRSPSQRSTAPRSSARATPGRFRARSPCARMRRSPGGATRCWRRRPTRCSRRPRRRRWTRTASRGATPPTCSIPRCSRSRRRTTARAAARCPPARCSAPRRSARRAWRRTARCAPRGRCAPSRATARTTAGAPQRARSRSSRRTRPGRSRCA
jgi:hypothetical protein